MAYFDSEKNKAMWQKRLNDLESERDRRKLEGYKPQPKNKIQTLEKADVKEGVRMISFDELVAKEQARTRARREMARARQLENQKKMIKDPKAL